MADRTAAFFDQLAERGHEPLLAKAAGTLRVELVNGGETERWSVAFDKGDITVSHKNTAADCTVRTDKASFDKIATGKMNAMAAVLRGGLTVEGDAELLVLFQRAFPGPPGQRGPARERENGPGEK
jgi:putative sterol carrier protein